MALDSIPGRASSVQCGAFPVDLEPREPVSIRRARLPDGRINPLERKQTMKNMIVAFALVACFAACKSDKASVSDTSAPKAECTAPCGDASKMNCEDKQAAGQCPATQAAKAASGCCSEKKPQG